MQCLRFVFPVVISDCWQSACHFLHQAQGLQGQMHLIKAQSRSSGSSSLWLWRQLTCCGLHPEEGFLLLQPGLGYGGTLLVGLTVLGSCPTNLETREGLFPAEEPTGQLGLPRPPPPSPGSSETLIQPGPSLPRAGAQGVRLPCSIESVVIGPKGAVGRVRLGTNLAGHRQGGLGEARGQCGCSHTCLCFRTWLALEQVAACVCTVCWRTAVYQGVPRALCFPAFCSVSGHVSLGGCG